MEATLTLIREQGIKVEKRSHEITPGEVQKILTSIEGTPEEPLISRLLLRSMGKSHLYPGMQRPLRTGSVILLPFYLTNPPLPGSADPPHYQG